MKKHWYILPPAVAGVLTAAVRIRAVKQGVDPNTGILTGSHTLMNLSFGLIAGFCLLWFLISFARRRVKACCFAPLDTTAYKMLLVLSAFSLMLSGAFFFFEFSQSTASLLTLVQALFSILCGVCVLMSFRCRTSPQVYSFCRLVPVFHSAFSLLLFYRGNNANPLTYSFAAELFAYLCCMFSFYSVAAFLFSKPRPRLFLFSSLSALYFLITILLSDNLLPGFTYGHLHFTVADILLLVGYLLLILAHLISFERPAAPAAVSENTAE